MAATTKYTYWPYGGTQRKWTSPAHVRNIYCFGIPAYQ